MLNRPTSLGPRGVYLALASIQSFIVDFIALAVWKELNDELAGRQTTITNKQNIALESPCSKKKKIKKNLKGAKL